MVDRKAVALDTNIAIAVLNGQKAIIEKLAAFEMIYLPVTVSGELLFGAKNSKNRTKNMEKFRAFIGRCVVLDINNLIAEEYSDIRLRLKQKGNPIPENDIWIAAICIANGLPLLTADRHFQNIDNLEVVFL